MLPTDLSARYAIARTDPKLLELRDEICLLDGRLSELLAATSIDWASVGELVDLRRRLVLAESRRCRDLRLHLPIAEANALFSAIADLIQEHADPSACRAIASGFRELVATRGYRPSSSAEGL